MKATCYAICICLAFNCFSISLAAPVAAEIIAKQSNQMIIQRTMGKPEYTASNDPQLISNLTGRGKQSDVVIWAFVGIVGLGLAMAILYGTDSSSQ